MNNHLKQWEQSKQHTLMNQSEQTNEIQQFDDLHLERLLPTTFLSERTAIDVSITHSNIETEPVPSLYNQELGRGELIGKLIIPSLDKEWPVIHGTDNKQLAQGVGHYIGSALPGEHDHAVLAGHRETVFRKLGEVAIGDHIQVETMAGLFTYEVESQYIVESDDRSVIVPSDEPLLTLITCYPFNYVGAAPQRYILTGKLIEL